MGKVGYDAFAGWTRLFTAADRLNANLAMILTLHAVLEGEMDDLLSRQVPRPGKLKGLGFGQKLGVIAATWQGDPEKGDLLCDALFRFNELRNCAAHANDPKQIAEAMQKLKDAHAKIGTLRDGIDVLVNIACDITSFMADDFPTIDDFGRSAEELGEALSGLTRAVAGFLERLVSAKGGSAAEHLSASPDVQAALPGSQEE